MFEVSKFLRESRQLRLPTRGFSVRSSFRQIGRNSPLYSTANPFRLRANNHQTKTYTAKIEIHVKPRQLFPEGNTCFTFYFIFSSSGLVSYLFIFTLMAVTCQGSLIPVQELFIDWSTLILITIYFYSLFVLL